MVAYFKLYNRFILRSLLKDKVRASLTVLGITLGVAVMIAIRLANASSLESFKSATVSVAGQTSLQIIGSTGRFDETRIQDIGWLGGYGRLSPVIDGYAMTETTPDSSEPGEFLHVLGIDILRDRPFRRYKLLQAHSIPNSQPDPQANSRDFLNLLLDPDAIILTEKFARARSLEIGGKIDLVMGDSRRQLTIRALLADEGPARALDGRIALMDIAAAQLAFGRLGSLDHLDIKLKPGISVDRAESEIGPRLPAGLKVTRPEASYGAVEQMIAAFHFNLSALGSIALLIGLFLIYNAVSVSVISRRDQVGMLRAAGATRRMILALFLGEAFVLSVVGAVAGLWLGRIMAAAAVRASAATVQTFYISSAATAEVTRNRLSVGEGGVALLIAIVLSILAALVPAIEASRVEPVEAIRGADRLGKSYRPPVRTLLLALLLFLIAGLLSQVRPIDGLPLAGYLAAVSVMFGGALLVPFGLAMVCRIFRIPIPRLRWLAAERKLAAANLGGAIPRIAISVAALAASLAMMVAITVMIESFRTTVSYWVDNTLRADIYAKPVTRTTAAAEGEIDDSAIEIIRASPDVAAVDTFSSSQIDYQGSPISLAAGDFKVFLEHGHLLFKSPANAPELMREAVDRNSVVVSESFSLRFRKAPGEMIELPTPTGTDRFKIAAVYFDYSSNKGSVVMDRATYQRIYTGGAAVRPGSLSIFLRPGADPDAVSRSLERATRPRFQIIFTTNASVRAEVNRIFNSTFAITYALEAIAIVVAALGVISSLITLILERKRELAILSYIGATRAQIRGMITLEALLISAVAQVTGILIGLGLSIILIYVINVQSFGWTIQFRFPVWFILQSTVLTLLAAVAAGLYPAARASRVAGPKALELVREE